MQVIHFACTQFKNFWHITRLSINKHFGGDEYLCKLNKEYLNA